MCSTLSLLFFACVLAFACLLAFGFASCSSLLHFLDLRFALLFVLLFALFLVLLRLYFLLCSLSCSLLCFFVLCYRVLLLLACPLAVACSACFKITLSLYSVLSSLKKLFATANGFFVFLTLELHTYVYYIYQKKVLKYLQNFISGVYLSQEEVHY
jgi:hypothetical protein